MRIDPSRLGVAGESEKLLDGLRLRPAGRSRTEGERAQQLRLRAVREQEGRRVECDRERLSPHGPGEVLLLHPSNRGVAESPRSYEDCAAGSPRYRRAEEEPAVLQIEARRAPLDPEVLDRRHAHGIRSESGQVGIETVVDRLAPRLSRRSAWNGQGKHQQGGKSRQTEQATCHVMPRSRRANKKENRGRVWTGPRPP